MVSVNVSRAELAQGQRLLNSVQLAWRSERGQLYLFVTNGGRCFLVQATRELAADWAAATWALAGRGHLNAESGLGDWPEGIAHLQALCG